MHSLGTFQCIAWSPELSGQLYNFISFWVGAMNSSHSHHISLWFLSANKIHECIRVSRPGINACIRLHLYESQSEKENHRKRLNGPQSGAGSRKMVELRGKRKINYLFQDPLGECSVYLVRVRVMCLAYKSHIPTGSLMY